MPSTINSTTTAGVAIQGDNSGVLALQTNNGTTAVTIDTSQNVGIGTTSPESIAGYSILQVGGSTSTKGVVQSSDGTVKVAMYLGADALARVGTRTNDPVLLITNATERMRISSAGDVFIGRTSDTDVAGISLIKDGFIRVNRDSAACMVINRNVDNGTLVSFRQAGNTVGTVDVTTTGTTYTGTNGITFTATQTASAGANTLDDYEEGTWTPTITRNSSNPTITYGTQLGVYVKIGRIVYVSCNVGWSANTGGSGSNWFISGLPFTNTNGGANYAQATIQDFNGITFSASRTQFGGYVNSAETRLFLCSGGSNQSTDNITVGSSGYMYMSGVYIAAN